MINIDGSQGEGGGQILRSSLALSMVTGKPFRIEKIRAGRKKPGLMRQHLTSVQAAAQVCGAGVQGDHMGSTEVTFSPGEVRSGKYNFSVGTAGSATLVCQTLLPPLLTAQGPSTLVLEGGTHNPFAPPFNFLEKSFAPLIDSMGPRIELILERYGFYPAGGGKMVIHIEPSDGLQPKNIVQRGETVTVTGEAYFANLPFDIAQRELAVVQKKMGLRDAQVKPVQVSNSPGPGNLVAITIESECVTEVVTGFGQRGVSAEKVAGYACENALKYLAAGAPVGEHLADQLLLPMAMAGRGHFRTVKPNPHTLTNRQVIQKFLDVQIDINRHSGDIWDIALTS